MEKSKKTPAQKRYEQAMKCVKKSNIKGRFMGYSELCDFIRSILHEETENIQDDTMNIEFKRKYFTPTRIIFSTSNNMDVLQHQRKFADINGRCVGLRANLIFHHLSFDLADTNGILIYNARASKMEELNHIRFTGVLGGFVNDRHLKRYGIADITLINSYQPMAYTIQIII